ncbi:MAG: porin [Cyclobacteriaceae bacterium]|nr:MAG: porin [Cyclobacteriaceae bacterium]
MRSYIKVFFIGSFFFINTLTAFGQAEISPSPYFTYGSGLGMISPDSLFMLNIRFRMQNRAAFTTVDENDFSIDQVEARVRRLRLRFEGFIYTPKLYYLIQLAFSRADMDYDDTGFPNVIRDAMVIYRFNEHFAIGLGQTKLPGNRQRVNSSGDLQLPDRSIVNSTFNIDRDFGAQVYYNNNIQGFHYVVRGAISSGDGRNITASDRGLAYTGRLELLPLGRFTNGGDYFEGDLVREPKPKISVGLTLTSNQDAIRTGGQLGTFLYEPRDIETRMIDFLYKHNGWSLSTEFLKRTSPNPLTQNTDGDIRYVYAGHGENYQASYLFKKNYELTGRFSRVRPDVPIQLFEEEVKQYTLGATKYIRGHRLKLQADVTYEQNHWLQDTNTDLNRWQLRLQIEAGI